MAYFSRIPLPQFTVNVLAIRLVNAIEIFAEWNGDGGSVATPFGILERDARQNHIREAAAEMLYEIARELTGRITAAFTSTATVRPSEIAGDGEHALR